MELVADPVLGKYRAETVSKAQQGRCEGACEKHRGHVEAVRVFDPKDGKDWGWFSYCEEARNEDASRGFEFAEQVAGASHE